MITWTTEKRKISDLIPAEYNPRQMTEKQVKDLTTSLERFNLADPIIINTDNKIIGGHQRIKIFDLHGKHDIEIDVRVPSRKLNPEEEKELNLRLNRNNGQWDFDALANFDEEMLKDVGFDSKELDKIFQLETKPEDDDVPKVRTTDIKLGDMFKLGEHFLLCSDCTVEANVARLMGGLKADMILTDPPYGMKLNADFSDMKGIAGGNKYENVIGDEVDYDPSSILDMFGYCKEIFLWGADYYAERIAKRNDGCFFVWDKTESGISPNSAYEKQFGSNFELCWSKAKHKRQVIGVLWKGIFGLSKEDTRKRLHPTQKPVRLLEWFMEHFSKRDNLVIDLFGGSGSTLIACEKLNRKCRMMEISPEYCEVIATRYENFTGDKRVKL